MKVWLAFRERHRYGKRTPKNRDTRADAESLVGACGTGWNFGSRFWARLQANNRETELSTRVERIYVGEEHSGIIRTDYRTTPIYAVVSTPSNPL